MSRPEGDPFRVRRHYKKAPINDMDFDSFGEGMALGWDDRPKLSAAEKIDLLYQLRLRQFAGELANMPHLSVDPNVFRIEPLGIDKPPHIE